MFRYKFLLTGFVFLSACSTVIDGPTQDVRVETPGAKDSFCYLENEYARYKVVPPNTIKITKFDKPFNVRCLASGNREKTIEIDPNLSDTVYLNAANGVIPGVLTDYNSRSMYTMPELIVVDFTDMMPTAYEKPDYHHDIMKNPNLAQYEEFRPGLPALMSDRYRDPYELQKTDRAISLIQSTSTGTSGSASMTPPPSSGGSTSSSSGSSADALTRSMNPDVFYSAPGTASGVPTNLK